MPTYVAYPKSKDTPNRKNRKSSRNVVFQKNRKINKVKRDKKDQSA
jgi:hypothetical protein